MEKKAYIEPSMRVKAVNMLLMAGLSTIEGEGDGGDLAKDINMSDDDNNVIGGHDVWED